ncbi:MAG: outer membrane lipoprotein-sorting protein [Pseudomonadota bacterium]|nr:outer membrane lipoprotein-sorting protein [Pseudomonadota bacterium]
MPYWLFLLILSCPVAFSDDSSTEARKIIEDMEFLYRGVASRATLTMTVITPRHKRTLKMSSASLGQDYALFRILEPRKESGISTLKREQEMWNYFPKINRVIKVPPSMMMGSWMGSDVTNDDLLRETELIDAYDLSMKVSESDYLITLSPKSDTVTVWAKIDYHVDRKAMLPKQQIFYDERDRKIRRMEFSETKDFEGTLLPSRISVIPINKPGYKTVVEYTSLNFDPPDVKKNMFTRRNLTTRF